jgi:hypothetical protein
MADHPASDNDLIPCWRARANLGGAGWTAPAFGFGSPDVAEVAGSPDAVGAALTRFLDSLSRQEVEAERLRTGQFFVRVEVEPCAQAPEPGPAPEAEDAGEDRVSRWEASASSANADGVFDGCYSYGDSQGDEAHLCGTAHELGQELARVLKLLRRDDVETMKYGTDRFYLDLVIQLPDSA